MAKNPSSYHHGDLRSALLEAATTRLETHGIEQLSLRKLAEDLGVSRTAPYHHFKDKSALLSAIAAQGFLQWKDIAEGIFAQQQASAQDRLTTFIREYVNYAATHPQIYDLMFGRTLWQQQEATEDLKAVAFPCFQFQVHLTKEWQSHGVLPKNQDTLRLAQVTWSTLHGLARLVIDGIYAESSHIDDMCACTAALFVQAGQSTPSE